MEVHAESSQLAHTASVTFPLEQMVDTKIQQDIPEPSHLPLLPVPGNDENSGSRSAFIYDCLPRPHIQLLTAPCGVSGWLSSILPESLDISVFYKKTKYRILTCVRCRLSYSFPLAPLTESETPLNWEIHCSILWY